jgi:multiple sugar transport system permease protein
VTAVPIGRKASAKRGGPVKTSDKTKAERKLAFLLCAPAVIAMLLVTLYPILYAIVLSVQKVDLRFPQESGFVGLSNYVAVLTSPLWWQDVFNTSLLTVVSTAIELVLGMGLALIMHRALFARGLIRTSVLIPYGIVTVVAAFGWRYAFDPQTGFVNGLPLIPDNKDWFGQHASAFSVIILTEVWNAVQRFLRITLPLLKPALLVALLFRTLDAFRVFDSIFVMTRGAQDTESVSILGYNQLISRLNLGLGSAVSVLIFVLVLLIAFVFVRGFGTAVPSQGDK